MFFGHIILKYTSSELQEIGEIMVNSVNIKIIDNIALLSVNNSPVNALSFAVREGIMSALDDIESDKTILCVVINGEGRTFPAGADIKEFGSTPKAPHLPTICDRIENFKKPVISAMHGTALGGGCEIALASHFRVAVEDARIGLPEVHLGLCPGAGGTQRLPRLIGPTEALKIMTSGNLLDSKKAISLGLIDELILNVKEGAVSFAKQIIEDNVEIIRTCDKTKKISNTPYNVSSLAQVKDSVIKTAKGLIAPEKIAECVEKTINTSFEEGQKFEAATFAQLKDTDQSKGLIHAFFAERQSGKIPEVNRGSPRDIKTLGIIGGGTMGSGITVAALNAGLEVTMIERDSENLERGRKNVEKFYYRDVEKGRITELQKETILNRYKTSTEFSSLGKVDMVIEAVFEELDVKKQVFKELDKFIKPGAVLASNTSYLDIDQIAAVTKRPEDVIGLHFFSPANVMKLLEIVVPKSVSDDVVATGFSLAKIMRKVPVRAGICDGFIGNRILNNYADVAAFMMEDGASPYEIDAAVRNFGYPMGPHQMFDLAGGDILWSTRKRQEPLRDPNSRYVRIADRLCENGWFGQKTGRGFYRYDTGERRGAVDPEVLEIIAVERKKKAIKPRIFSSEEIIRRYMAAMINEAANVVYEGIALRPSDVDVTKLYGYGFPRYRGGPMKYADTYGLDKLLNDLKAFESEDPLFWKPSPLITKLVKEGNNFESLNI